MAYTRPMCVGDAENTSGTNGCAPSLNLRKRTIFALNDILYLLSMTA